MPASFDPYTKWLAITDPQRPPHHYQLIGLAPLCDDVQAIRAAADAALVRLRSVDPGANAAEWQQLLDELSIARMTLTNPMRKLQYDAQLRTRLAEATSSVLQAATASQSTPVQAPVVSQPPIAAPPRATLSQDPNMFPPGATPAVAPPMTVRTATPPVAAGPVAVPQVQSYAMPPIQVAAQSTALPAGAPVNAPVSKPVAAQIPQAALATPSFGAAAQPPQSMPAAARSFDSVPMPPILERQPSAAQNIATQGGQRFADADVPLFAVEAASLAAARPASGASSEAEESSAAASAAPLEDQGDEPIFGTADVTPVRPAAESFAVPEYLTRQSHKSPTGAIVGGTAVVVLIVVAIILGTARKRPPDDESTKVASAGPSTDIRNDAPVAQQAVNNPAPKDDQPAEPAKPVADAPADANQERPVADDAPQPAPIADDASPAMPDEAEPAAEPSPANTTPPEPAPVEPTSPPTDPKPEADPAKSAAFARSVKLARAALGARNLAKAKQEVEAAVAAASTQPQHDQAERLRLLAGYVDEFWTNVGKALNDLQPTDEVKIGSTTAAVVESDSTSITVHVAGKNLSYKLADMPVGLVIALADRWFDAKNPTTKVFYGAFHAADAKGDVKEAKRLWEEANLAGAPTADLLPLLHEGAPTLVAEQGPVPDDKQLAAAEKTFKAAYQQELRTAKSPQRKLEMAKKLVDVALTTEDPAERYVLFREGYKIASEGGNPPGILRAVDEMAKWYDVDALDLKSAALAKAAAATTNSLVAKAVARSALDLVDQAVSDKRLEHAGKLSQAALVAAKKSKDAALVKQATERDQQVREMNSER